ncbi:MAG: D-alanyl-D-alanine carboxypeptidase family protein [Paracoccaceae bacterium]
MSGVWRVIAGLAIMIGAIMAWSGAVSAAPYAAFVMDARSGEVLHESSADRRLHPASLTKMMTLYLTFEAVTSGKLSLDQRVTISRHVAAQPASKIGMRAGSKVTIRELIRAASVKSANDAAAALAEALGGSESGFAKLMTAKARMLGMSNTTFKNASGLTAAGQYSTARDMALMGRALFYDFPQYYNLFSRISTPTMGRTVYNTNRRFLRSYRGADGIKTGFTNAAGFNLVSSAERGDKRVIAVVFGGRSSATRNAKVAELLDLGFRKAPSNSDYISTASLTARYGGASTKVASSAATRSPAPMVRPGSGSVFEPESRSLLAQAGAALVPAAVAAEMPQDYTKLSPRRSPAPKARPGSEIAAIPVAAHPGGETDWAVQIGIFAKQETAIAELASAALGGVRGLSHAGRDVDEFRLAGQPAWRAQLTGFDRPSALAACAAIQSRGHDCVPMAGAGH